MLSSAWPSWLLAGAAVLVTLSSYPYMRTAIAYRRRDNGLAYLVLVMSVGGWNGTSAAQLLGAEVYVKAFYYSLSTVGASLAGLGWFLFAGTASSTPDVRDRGALYGVATVLVGVNITLAITSPVHDLYWTLPPETATTGAFAVVVLTVGYWLYTLLVALFGAETILFARAWRTTPGDRYPRAYTVAGTATIVAILGSNVLAPGGLTVAPLVAAGLTTVGWVQASRGRVPGPGRSALP